MNKKIDLEDVEIPSPQYNYIVRQDRKTISLDEVFLEVNDNRLPIDNISLFGVSVITNDDRFDKKNITASLIIKNQEIQKICFV